MKRFVRPIIIGICLGIVLVIIEETANIREDLFLRGVLIGGIIAVLAAVIFNVGYILSYQKRMARLVPLLDVGASGEYIAEMEALLEKARGESLRNVLRLNLSAGYIEHRDYKTALEILESLPERGLSGEVVKLCYRINLCIARFYSGSYEQAMACAQESEALFVKYRDDRTYGCSIAEIDILAALLDGQLDRAALLLDETEQSWTQPRHQKVYQEIRQQMERMAQKTSDNSINS